MNLDETKRYLAVRLGQLKGDDHLYYDLLIHAYEDYFSNRDLVAAAKGDSALLRVATREKAQAHGNILKICKYFSIAPTPRKDETKQPSQSALDLLG